MGPQLAPVEAGIGMQHDALCESGGPRGGADRIEGFLALQGLVAVDDIGPREAAPEMPFELLGPDAHATRGPPRPARGAGGSCSTRERRLDTARDLSGRVAAHLGVEHALLAALPEHRVPVEHVVSKQRHRLSRHQFLAVSTGHVERHLVGEFELALFPPCPD